MVRALEILLLVQRVLVSVAVNRGRLRAQAKRCGVRKWRPLRRVNIDVRQIIMAMARHVRRAVLITDWLVPVRPAVHPHRHAAYHLVRHLLFQIQQAAAQPQYHQHVVPVNKKITRRLAGFLFIDTRL